MREIKFNVGDRVFSDYRLDIGTILSVNEESKNVLVKWDCGVDDVEEWSDLDLWNQ